VGIALAIPETQPADIVRTSPRGHRNDGCSKSPHIGSIEATKKQLEEWMKPVKAPIPKFLAETESAHRACSPSATI
jgi:hypothetical protein